MRIKYYRAAIYARDGCILPSNGQHYDPAVRITAESARKAMKAAKQQAGKGGRVMELDRILWEAKVPTQ